jgi:hypothetical protein
MYYIGREGRVFPLGLPVQLLELEDSGRNILYGMTVEWLSDPFNIEMWNQEN